MTEQYVDFARWLLGGVAGAFAIGLGAVWKYMVARAARIEEQQAKSEERLAKKLDECEARSREMTNTVVQLSRDFGELKGKQEGMQEAMTHLVGQVLGEIRGEIRQHRDKMEHYK